LETIGLTVIRRSSEFDGWFSARESIKYRAIDESGRKDTIYTFKLYHLYKNNMPFF
jgi:hypothetical protein